jgi:phosphoheptose isomerase
LKSHLHHERLPQVISVRESIQDAVAAIELLYNLEAPIRSAAQVLEQALLSGKKVLTCGNGGSAADSSHMATEIACRFIDDRRPFPAISLSADGGVLTATANVIKELSVANRLDHKQQLAAQKGSSMFER